MPAQARPKGAGPHTRGPVRRLHHKGKSVFRPSRAGVGDHRRAGGGIATFDGHDTGRGFPIWLDLRGVRLAQARGQLLFYRRPGHRDGIAGDGGIRKRTLGKHQYPFL